MSNKGETMAKKKKKTKRKRNLKYGNIASSKVTDLKKEVIIDDGSKKAKPFVSETNPEFKRELRKNLIFVGGFFLLLIILYLILTKTNLLNPILNSIGLNGLYK